MHFLRRNSLLSAVVFLHMLYRIWNCYKDTPNFVVLIAYVVIYFLILSAALGAFVKWQVSQRQIALQSIFVILGMFLIPPLIAAMGSGAVIVMMSPRR